MIRVIVESPYAARMAKDAEAEIKEIQRNVEYARRCLIDCLHRGEAPFASHLLYTQVLFDGDPDDRSLGIAAGLCWGEKADKTVVYTDFGVSNGMQLGIDAAMALGRPVEYRAIGIDAKTPPAFPGHAPDCPTATPMQLGDQALMVNVPVVHGVCTACRRRVAS